MIELKTKHEKSKQDLNSLELEHDKLTANASRLSNQLKQFQDEVKNLVHSNKLLSQELDDNKEYIGKLRANNEKYCAESSQLRKTKEEVVKENNGLLDANRELKSQLNEARDLSEILNSENQAMKAQIEHLCTDNELLHQQINDLNSKLSKNAKDMNSLMQEKETIKQQYEISLNSSIEDNRILNKKVSTLETERNKLKVVYIYTP
eukprot:TRINITY_DN10095_c0_g1_i1.p3 TRINITY_DN10095_c0_g1~~TRINITY_DN10095_c0_g1_i1.p3  ORF type:complete len:206 (-),score=67.38 TRINITY_DN10095_c0_g1_i1:503-1120(-)